jgi:D-serine deaminase-like pyridoxal phosphate-dependent protein
MACLDGLDTPCLLLRREVLQANCARMIARADALGVALRPHMKTAKASEVAEIASAGQAGRPGGKGGITVSTLAEAAFFLEAGFMDMTYAVGIVPQKLAAVSRLQGRGARIAVITDDLDGAAALTAAANRLLAEGAQPIPVLIEVDCGGARAGLPPSAGELVQLGRLLDEAPGFSLEGVLTHAGHSYGCRGIDEVVAVAEAERLSAVEAAEALRSAGLPAPVVSVGSTPTALHARRLDGVTEMRPGVYMLGDLTQMALGSCGCEDIAAAVMARVTGHNRRAGHLLIDAGGLALSKDVSAGNLLEDVGYGRLCGLDFKPLPQALYVDSLHQEHGLVKGKGGSAPDFDRFPLGQPVLVLPNHICMTAAAYDGYHVVSETGEVEGFWRRAVGW